MVLFLGPLGAAVYGGLAIENAVLEKKRKKRVKSVNARRNAESEVSKKLQPIRAEHTKKKNMVNQQRYQNTKIQKKANNAIVNRNKRQSIRNSYRDNVNPQLRNTQTSLQSEIGDITDEYTISDTKNKVLLSSIVDRRDVMEQDKLNIFGKKQQLHDQINKQNHNLEQTFQGLTQKHINLDRRPTYEDHIKMEYSLSNVALWYMYYILLAVLYFMYRKQDNMKQPRTIVMMVGLLLFPYWMVILEVIMNNILTMQVYAKRFAETLSRIPEASNKLFESLF
jgi:hypothetical protein